jgi:hypothetical protein
MLVGVVEVGDGCVDVAGTASAEIGSDGGEFFSVAGDEEETRSLGSPDAAGGLGNAGGSAEDENLARSLNWSIGDLRSSAHRLVGPVSGL